MKRKNPTPSYLFHRQSGRARACWTDPTGRPRQQLLPGVYDSPEFREAHARLALELALTPAAAIEKPTSATVNEVCAAYIDFAAGYNASPDG